MKKALLILICLSFTLCAVPAFAFDTYHCGDQEVNVWGFLRNNLGMFERTQEFTNSGNQLATARTWLRAYMDWKMSEQFKFYTAVQFVWEPWYKVEEGSTASENGGNQYMDSITQHRKSGWKTYSEFDDVNDVIREVYIEWKPSKKHTIKFGRQIAIWGEALTDRVGDVIHPNDSRFSFAFANLEDTRIPQYMIRGYHDIETLSSSFEWIINPLLTQSNYSVNRGGFYANQFSDGGAEQRFAIRYIDDYYPGRTGIPGIPLSSIPRFQFGGLFSQLTSTGVTNNYDLSSAIIWPVGSSFYSYAPAGFLYPGSPAMYLPSEIPYVHQTFPSDFKDTRFGFRTSTLLGGYQFGISYWHTQSYDPIMKRGGIVGYTVSSGQTYPMREYELYYPTMDTIGFYMNKQLPWPGVIRAELAYSPNKAFSTFNILDPGVALTYSRTPFFNPYSLSDESAVVKRDWVKYMLAYDLNSFFYFDWHKTAPFDVTFEHIGEWIPNSSDLQYIVYNTKLPNYHASFNARLSTNWLYNRFSTEIILGYDTFGNSWLFMPAVKWMPGWMNSKFSAELKYIGISADSDYEGLGMFRKKDMLILTTQFNF